MSYEPGILDRIIKRAAADEFNPPSGIPSMQVRIRAGHEGRGKLPPVPENGERLRDESYSPGDLNRFVEKRAAMDPMDLAQSGEAEPVEMLAGPAAKALDYTSRGVMGAGAGQLLGSFFRSRGGSEALQRRLGLAGLLAGVGMAAASQREAKRLAMAKMLLQQKAMERQQALEEGEEHKKSLEPIRAMLEADAKIDGAGKAL